MAFSPFANPNHLGLSMSEVVPNGKTRLLAGGLSLSNVLQIIMMIGLAGGIIFREDKEIGLLNQNIEELTLEVCELRAQITGIDANKAVLFCQNHSFMVPFSEK